ncbi:hypothetical protein [Gilvimarinus algae]|uniref:Uncharacterized protein n=1 Tax=Gilvimarinus algae TaxID=3058037 RepID=A0ABT8TFW6_9GAMM|nr:hypothetical protein [Gilvimarinus sp. SDUM040014]MDO3382419.1 hypothetical protein [Gilvimarinus sp. SDUM040014]
MKVPSKRGRISEWNPSDGHELPDERLMGRFLGMAALEILVHKVQGVEAWNMEVVDNKELDDLRKHVRFNEGDDWPFMFRTLHPVNAVFDDEKDRYEILHEFDLLITDNSECYSLVSIFGVEFSLNLGGRTLEGYKRWLSENENVSPLYVGKNA